MKEFFVLPLILCAADSTRVLNWQDCPGVIAQGEPPASLPDCVAGSGATASSTLSAKLGQPIADIRAKSTLPIEFGADGMYFVTGTPVNLTWSTLGRTFEFSNVGGMNQTALILVLDNSRRLSSLEFAWQNRPLKLSELMGRAQLLKNWLADSGYTLDASYGDPEFFVANDGLRPITKIAKDWPEAETMLFDERNNIEEIHLYALKSSDGFVAVSAVNMRRKTWNFQRKGAIQPVPGWKRSIFDGNGGYEWKLAISIRRPI